MLPSEPKREGTEDDDRDFPPLGEQAVLARRDATEHIYIYIYIYIYICIYNKQTQTNHLFMQRIKTRPVHGAERLLLRGAASM